MSYTKEKLASDLADLRNVSKASAAETIDAVLNLITGAVEVGEKVALRGFGTFVMKARPARTGRNPNTGQPIAIPASTTLHFKATKGKA